MRARIAMVGACPYPVPQGSQALLTDTARAAQSAGYEVHLVVYGYGVGDASADLCIHRCANIPGQGKTRSGPSWAKPALDLSLIMALRRVIRTQRIDVVHAHNYEGLAVALAAGKRPIVYHAHNAMADELPFYFGQAAAARKFGRWLDGTLPRRADWCIASHAGLAEYLIEQDCAADCVKIIAPSADIERFSPSAVSDALPPILYTGNLDAYQNLDLLQEVMKRVRRRFPAARLVMGTPDGGAITGAEGIRVDEMDGLCTLFKRDAVVACPRVSWSGYPIKLLNAMAAGKAIVACAGAAHPLEHEKTGLVVADGDAEAFAGALCRLVRDSRLRGNLGRAARRAAETRHAPAQYSEQLEAVYEAALEAVTSPSRAPRRPRLGMPPADAASPSSPSDR